MLRYTLPILVILLGITDHLHSQSKYQTPPQSVVKIIDAKPAPGVSFSPDRKWMLHLERDAMPSIKDVSRRMLRLAGLRIDPASSSRFSTSFIRGIKFIDRDTMVTMMDTNEGSSGEERPRFSSISWSHKSNAVAVVWESKRGSFLSVAECEAGKSAVFRSMAVRVNTIFNGISWMPDGNRILCTVVAEKKQPEPKGTGAPAGPNIQESSGNKSPTRTYQDLLKNPHDEALFEYYATSQLATITFDGTVKTIGKPGIITNVEPSPDGKYFIVQTIQKPFSYLQTYRSFPHNIEVWDLRGRVVYSVAQVPLATNIPIEGVRTGPRNVTWKTGESATLIWTEALDGGDPNKKAKHRDKIVTFAAPFNGQPKEIAKTQHRAFGATFLTDTSKFMTTEYDRNRRWVTTKLHDLKNGGTPKVVEDRSIRDRYGDPGRLVTRRDKDGHAVVWQDGDWIYRIGRGASPKGMLPFIDRQNLKTMKTERLWRCKEGTYESVAGIIASSKDKKPIIVTSKETPTTPANYVARNLNDGSEKKLTNFKDPTPQIRGIKKKLVTYKRSDGVPLSATLYLPADYKEGTKLPLLVWAYPREFNDRKTAGQVSASPSRFTRIASISHLTLVTQGYAVMDAATMPVIGDPKTMNDTFVEQIVDAAKAAIDKAVEMGVADRDRVGVGGHSYGAFMTANLLAHCDLFRAGIARSGAYNRTLTPFGFQSERRTVWEAPELYFKISPFLHAHKIDEPMLMIHGEADNNSGTFPMQSRRMYQAIKGNGGTVRLVMLPNESHGYRARESVLHTQAEMLKWMDKHVKNAKPRKKKKDRIDVDPR